MQPERLYAAFYVVLVNCAEQAHVWELPQEASIVLGTGEDEARDWVRGLLPGLVKGGFAELSRLVFEAPENDSYRDVEASEVEGLVVSDAVWVPRRMGDGTVIVVTLTDAGSHLLQALSYPPGLSMAPTTTFTM